ncbi:VOC family protein [Planomonospora sp. ID82291]|uniref:VOC family protein n=1 Tax=Planomonospora sp. ID82291 TaxID=2738136 RepID=UPI0018C361AD|nr:VOC family protein [Planomonospora sp. ID82291]MBG0817880.1 VOC family protein [Planomonospora sp. ID82291]
MIGAITSVPVYVADVTASLDFFVGVLGFATRTDSAMGPMRWVEVAPAGGQSALVLTGPGFESWAPEKVGVFTGIVFALTDAGSTADHLRRHGVPIVSGPQRMPWGVQLVFADPDGNTFAAVGT